MTKKNTLQVGDLTLVPEARSRYLTLEMGGKKCRIHYKELWGAMFVLGDGKYRAEMVPHKKQERMVFSRKLQIQAKKDIKAGDTITVWVEFDVAKDVAQSIVEKNGGKVLEETSPVALSTPPAQIAGAPGV